MRNHDRVKFTSTSTGTGDMVVGAAVPKFRTPPNGLQFTYLIEDDLGNWEVGYGTMSGVTALQRTVVIDNSAGSAPTKIDFPAGTKIVSSILSAQTGINVFPTFGKAAPDTSADGAIAAGPGAAAGGLGAIAIGEDSSAPSASGIAIGKGAKTLAGGGIAIGPGTTLSATLLTNVAFMNGKPRNSNSWYWARWTSDATLGFQQEYKAIERIGTADATPTVLTNWAIPSTGVWTFDIDIIAQNRTTNVECWAGRITGAARRATLLGTPVLTPLGSDASLNACTAAVSIVSNALRLTVTGIAATNLRWSAMARGLDMSST